VRSVVDIEVQHGVDESAVCGILGWVDVTL
jgi:hypothetical protein